MNLDELRSCYDFSGRTVLVTGGTGALGWEIASTLAQCNANVAVLSRSQAQTTHSALKGNGQALFVRADVLHAESLQQAQETVKTEFGPVDILINTAGGNHPSATTRPELSFFDLALDALRHVGDLNFLGTVLPCQVFGRGMAERGEGVILNISLMTSFRPLTWIPAYSASKAAINNFTQYADE